MCPESRLPRGSKIMTLLDWFPEIHLRLSMHYCPNGAIPSAGSGWEQPILTKWCKILPDFTPFVFYQFGVNNACYLHRLLLIILIASHLAVSSVCHVEWPHDAILLQQPRLYYFECLRHSGQSPLITKETECDSKPSGKETIGIRWFSRQYDWWHDSQ